MGCTSKIVICAAIVTCTEQFLFPDRLQHAWTRKLSPRTSHSVLSHAVQYPEPEIDNEIGNSFHPMMNNSLCENGYDFCSEPIVYPVQAIAKALNKQKSSVLSMFDKNYLRDLSPRARSGLTESHMENVCGMTTTHIMPKAAKNKKGQFKFLVNGGEGAEEYLQLVQISQCSRAGEPCGHGHIFAREVTECRQEFSDHKLVALDEAGKELVVDTFSFPSCCSCYMHSGMEI